MRVIFSAIALFFIFIGAASAQLKLGEVTWSEKYGWEEGLTDLIPFDAYPPYYDDYMGGGEPPVVNHFVIAVNSDKGTFRVYGVNEDGTLGDIVDEKTGIDTGTWGTALFADQMEYNNYLMIMHSGKGTLESYALSYDGKIGEKVWSSDAYEKGIEQIVQLSNHILMYRKDAGWAWIYEAKPDGSLAELTWSTKGWTTGIEGISSFDRWNLFLTKPDGNAWVFYLSRNELKQKWHTTDYHKGISVSANLSIRSGGRIFIADPEQGKQWYLLYKHSGMEVKWQDFGWEKGITKQAAVYEGRYLMTVKPEIGGAWIYQVR